MEDSPVVMETLERILVSSSMKAARRLPFERTGDTYSEEKLDVRLQPWKSKQKVAKC
jgi:hypothetical protein